MEISDQHRKQLRMLFLKVYQQGQPMMETKDEYRRQYSKLNLPWCWPCQLNSTFKQFRFNAEDMSSEEIQQVLDSNTTTMPVKKKAVTKKATANKATTKPKKTAVKKTSTAKKVIKETTKKAVASTPTLTPTPTIKDSGLPGNIKFLYIPKRKI